MVSSSVPIGSVAGVERYPEMLFNCLNGSNLVAIAPQAKGFQIVVLSVGHDDSLAGVKLGASVCFPPNATVQLRPIADTSRRRHDCRSG